ncbi:MAG: hypothetical protein LLG01_07970 [Planctomycetaceae bacterium]|nr:hypothetical protein [Planctomycetaceae bacterium]
MTESMATFLFGNDGPKFAGIITRAAGLGIALPQESPPAARQAICYSSDVCWTSDEPCTPR